MERFLVMPGPDGSVVHILDALTGRSEVVKLPASAGGKRKPIPVHAYEPVPATVVGINLAA